MSKVHLEVLGSFKAVIDDSEEVSLTAKKCQALLGYLALHSEKPIAREKLAALLWTDTAGEFARTNLRQGIAVIRKALDHEKTPSLINQGDSLFLDKSVVSSDAAEFNQCLKEGTPDSIERALSLYRGELMEGIGLEDCTFHDWLVFERRRIQDDLTVGAHNLLEHYRLSEQTELELATATKLLSLDAHDETAHRAIMYAHDRNGRRHLALKQFEICKLGLQQDLGVKPESATSLLYDDILQEKHKNENRNTNLGSASAPDTTLVKRSIFKSRKFTGFTATAALLMLALLVRWQAQTDSSDSLAEQTFPELQDSVHTEQNPTIAVLPFTNLSDDSNQDYFSDGLSEDLITDLSRLSGLNVIARASSFSYKDQDQDISEVAKELGASIVLTGTVRREQNNIRLNVQLVDADKGTQLWAGRYDRNDAEILKLQDELAHTVVTELSLSLSKSEQEELDRVLQVDTDAYDLFLKSLRPLRELTPGGVEEARALLERVIEMDPSFARAHANLALTYNQEVIFGYSKNPEEALRRGFSIARQAADLDDSMPQLYFLFSALHLSERSHEEAVAAARRAIALDPNYADGFANLAQQLMFAGNLKAADLALQKAKKLNPRFTFTYLWVEGQILLLSRKFDEALGVFEDINERNPSFVSGQLLTISTLGHLGRTEDAEWNIAELETLIPDISLSLEEKTAFYQLEEHKDLYIQGLALAGLSN